MKRQIDFRLVLQGTAEITAAFLRLGEQIKLTVIRMSGGQTVCVTGSDGVTRVRRLR